jgi:hypothetical protein
MTGPDRDRKTLGSGAEAAEGVHALQQDDAGGASAAAPSHRTGASDVSNRGASADDQPGSEPLPRTREHVPSYGGAGGAPRTSSDTREPPDARGDQGHRAPPRQDGRGRDEEPINPS